MTVGFYDPSFFWVPGKTVQGLFAVKLLGSMLLVDLEKTSSCKMCLDFFLVVVNLKQKVLTQPMANL